MFSKVLRLFIQSSSLLARTGVSALSWLSL